MKPTSIGTIRICIWPNGFWCHEDQLDGTLVNTGDDFYTKTLPDTLSDEQIEQVVAFEVDNLHKK